MHIIAARFVCLLFAWSSVGHANLTQPNDGPYRARRASGTLYVYADDGADVIEELKAFSEGLRPMYERSFGWRLDEEEDLILASGNQQFANAFATVTPNLKTFWYPSGAGEADALAVPSWGRMIASHETSHLYQLNAKGPFNARLKRVFGNAPAVSLLPWPIVIHPNLLAPTALLEGNAVLNESRLNIGGRLHSAEVRATVLRLIAADQVDAARVINDQFKFPYGESAYDLGAYFMAHLTAKYGIDQVNGFFRAQGDHWLNPLILNRTFRAHFGASFYQEVREFTRGLEPLARAQRVSTGEGLSEGVRVSPLNHDAARVWWLSNPGYRTPDLFVFDKRTRTVSSRAIDLLDGKVFFAGERPLSAANNQNDLHHRSYGLYGEHAHLEPGTRGLIVTDERGGHRVGLDATRSWLAGAVVLDGEPHDLTNSSPILDADGHVYHFRQVGAERLLYRDRELITRVAGYYAKLTEVDTRGRVHFIAATERGATLYRYAAGEVNRLLESDAVMDARLLDDTHAVVKEVTARGYRVLVTALVPTPGEPAVYVYPFVTETVHPSPPSPPSTKAPNYNGLRELRFSALDAGFGYASTSGPLAGVSAQFTDPLEYHALGLDLGYSGRGPRRARVQYDFGRYLISPFVRYAYREDTWRGDDGHHRYVDQELNLGFNLPLLRRDRWDAKLDLALVLEREGLDDRDAVTHDTFGSFTRLSAIRQIPSPLGMYPWRRLEFGLSHRQTEGRANEREQSAGLEAAWDHGFGGEYYLNVAAQVATSNGPHLDVGYNPYPLATRLLIPRLSGTDFKTRQAARARIEARRVITLPRYDTRIPVGLNRVALLLAGQAMTVDGRAERGPGSLYEVGYGVDLDLLLGHKLRVTSRLLGGVANDPSDAARPFTVINLSTKGSF